MAPTQPRPNGSGWVPITQAECVAGRAVPSGIAVRKGAEILARNRVSKGWVNPRDDLRLDDRSRGVRAIARDLVRNWIKTGIIERQGDWVRLTRPPYRNLTVWGQRLAVFLAEVADEVPEDECGGEDDEVCLR